MKISSPQFLPRGKKKENKNPKNTTWKEKMLYQPSVLRHLRIGCCSPGEGSGSARRSPLGGTAWPGVRRAPGAPRSVPSPSLRGAARGAAPLLALFWTTAGCSPSAWPLQPASAALCAFGAIGGQDGDSSCDRAGHCPGSNRHFAHDCPSLISEPDLYFIPLFCDNKPE